MTAVRPIFPYYFLEDNFMFLKLSNNNAVVSLTKQAVPTLEELGTIGSAINMMDQKLFYVDSDGGITEKDLTTDDIKTLLGVERSVRGRIEYKPLHAVNGTIITLNDIGRTYEVGDLIALPFGQHVEVLIVSNDDTVVVDRLFKEQVIENGTVVRTIGKTKELTAPTQLTKLWNRAYPDVNIVPRLITRVIVLGASILRDAFKDDGKVEAEERWADLGHNVEVVREAIGGNRSADYLSRLPAIIDAYKAEALTTMFVLHGPGNDITVYPNNAQLIEDNMREICTMIKDNGFTLAMSTITYRQSPSSKISSTYNEMIINDLIEEFADIALDGWTLTYENRDTWHSSDGVHSQSSSHHVFRDYIVDTTSPYMVINGTVGVPDVPDVTDPVVPSEPIDNNTGIVMDDKPTTLAAVNSAAPVIDPKDATEILFQVGETVYKPDTTTNLNDSYTEYPMYDTDGNYLDGATITVRGNTDRAWMYNFNGRGDVDSGDESISVYNQVILANSLFVSGERGEHGFIDFSNAKLDPTATYRLSVIASRSTDDSRRIFTYAIGDLFSIVVDASTDPAQHVEFELTGQQLMDNSLRYTPGAYDNFAYVNAMLLEKL